MRDIIFIVLTLCIGLNTVQSYPGGAPVDRCGDMQPRVSDHGEAQAGPSNYILGFNSDAMTYDTDDITVTISGEMLKGLFCQMRDTDGNQVGSFVESDDLQTLDCPGGEGSGITHKTNDDKSDVMFTWTPPGSDMGELTLRCTLVKVKEMYWVGVEAEQKLMYDADSDSAPAFHSGFLVFLIVAAEVMFRALSF